MTSYITNQNQHLLLYRKLKVLLYGFSKLSILIGWQVVPWSVFSVSGPVSRMSFIWREIFALQTEKIFAFQFSNCMSLKFTDKNLKQPNCFWLTMHAYRILLPSETDDSRFNSREKHMHTDSVQPYNKPIIDLACSVCTVKYQISLCFLHGPRSFVARSILKNLGLIFHSTDLTLGQ
jgi:hypothetical protein